MKSTLAAWISTLGHPLLTLPVFAVVMLFRHEPPEKAAWLSALIVGGLALPIALKTYRGMRKGVYANFDVSDRAQRRGWYRGATVLMLGVTAVLWLTGQSRPLCLSFLFASLLLLASQGVNYYLKTSLHLAFHVFLAFLILAFDPVTGIVLLSFAPLLAWSRLVLGRHSWQEVLSGALLGTAAGAGFFGMHHTFS